MSIKRGVIVARIKPGSEEEVARIFAESDATELPRITGVRHRSLWVLDDVYIHLVETDEDFASAVDNIRDHELFKDISRKLDPFIQPYNPETWRSPKDAQAKTRELWEASLELVRENVQAVAQTNVKMMELWADMLRKNADGAMAAAAGAPKAAAK